MDGIIETKPSKKPVTSSGEMLSTIMRLNDMVLLKGWKIYDREINREVRKMMEENPDSDPPVILIATGTKWLGMSDSLSKSPMQSSKILTLKKLLHILLSTRTF